MVSKNKLISIGLGVYLSVSVAIGGFIGYKAYKGLSREFKTGDRVYSKKENCWVDQKFKFRGWVRVVGGGLAGLCTTSLLLAPFTLAEEAKRCKYYSLDSDSISRTAGEYYPFNTLH